MKISHEDESQSKVSRLSGQNKFLVLWTFEEGFSECIITYIFLDFYYISSCNLLHHTTGTITKSCRQAIRLKPSSRHYSRQDCLSLANIAIWAFCLVVIKNGVRKGVSSVTDASMERFAAQCFSTSPTCNNQSAENSTDFSHRSLGRTRWTLCRYVDKIETPGICVPVPWYGHHVASSCLNGCLCESSRACRQATSGSECQWKGQECQGVFESCLRLVFFVHCTDTSQLRRAEVVMAFQFVTSPSRPVQFPDCIDWRICQAFLLLFWEVNEMHTVRLWSPAQGVFCCVLTYVAPRLAFVHTSRDISWVRRQVLYQPVSNVGQTDWVCCPGRTAAPG